MKTSFCVIALSSIGVASAGKCHLENHVTERDPSKLPVETRTDLCRTQGEDAWTWGMTSSMVNFPAPAAGAPPNAGMAQSYNIAIYDNDCKIRGTYSRPSDQDCSGGYYIQESFMPYTMDFKYLRTTLGDEDWRFDYGAGEYSNRNNHCGCASVDTHSIVAEKACACPFPLDGDYEHIRRSLGSERRQAIAFKG